jgi:hypothetical protein
VSAGTDDGQAEITEEGEQDYATDKKESSYEQTEMMEDYTTDKKESNSGQTEIMEEGEQDHATVRKREITERMQQTKKREITDRQKCPTDKKEKLPTGRNNGRRSATDKIYGQAETMEEGQQDHATTKEKRK